MRRHEHQGGITHLIFDLVITEAVDDAEDQNPNHAEDQKSKAGCGRVGRLRGPLEIQFSQGRPGFSLRPTDRGFIKQVTLVPKIEDLEVSERADEFALEILIVK